MSHILNLLSQNCVKKRNFYLLTYSHSQVIYYSLYSFTPYPAMSHYLKNQDFVKFKTLIKFSFLPHHKNMSKKSQNYESN